MKLRDHNCHVEMKPDFLFDIHKQFKSFYTPWVYICIYLSDVRSVKFAPDNYFRINTKEIANLLDIDPATISRAKKQLVAHGLIETKGHSFRVQHDKCESLFERTDGFKNFIKVNNNFLLVFLPRLKESLPETNPKERTLLKTLQVYYYLIAKNSHFLINTPVVESKETPESISEFLHHDKDYTKRYLGLLESVGQISIDDDGKISTVYGWGECKPFQKKQVNHYNNFSHYYSSKVPLERMEEEKSFEDTTLNKEQRQEPVSDMERIGYVMSLSNGDRKKMSDLLNDNNISEESFREYLDKYY